MINIKNVDLIKLIKWKIITNEHIDNFINNKSGYDHAVILGFESKFLEPVDKNYYLDHYDVYVTKKQLMEVLLKCI